MSAETCGTLTLIIPCQVYKTMDSLRFPIEPGSNDVKIPGQATVVASIYSICTKVCELQQSCVLGGQKEGDLSQCAHLPPPGTASPEAFAQNLQICAVARLSYCNDASLFGFPTCCVAASDKQIEPAYHVFKGPRIKVVVWAPRLLDSNSKEHSLSRPDNLVDTRNQLTTLL